MLNTNSRAPKQSQLRRSGVFTPFSSVSIVDFEKVKVSLVHIYWHKSIRKLDTLMCKITSLYTVFSIYQITLPVKNFIWFLKSYPEFENCSIPALDKEINAYIEKFDPFQKLIFIALIFKRVFLIAYKAFLKFALQWHVLYIRMEEKDIECFFSYISN